MLTLESFASITATVAGYMIAATVVLAGLALGSLWLVDLL